SQGALARNRHDHTPHSGRRVPRQLCWRQGSLSLLHGRPRRRCAHRGRHARAAPSLLLLKGSTPCSQSQPEPIATRSPQTWSRAWPHVARVGGQTGRRVKPCTRGSILSDSGACEKRKEPVKTDWSATFIGVSLRNLSQFVASL